MSQTEDFRGTLLECYEAYNETAEHLVRVPARNVRPIDRERSGTRRRCSLTSCASLRPSRASALTHPKRAPNRSGTSRPPRSPSNRSSPPGPETLRPPAQSNFSGVQHPLEWTQQAHAHGWDVLLDAAAFVPTNRLDLGRWHPDFVALSVYKMFGWPTGVGCLLARREALAKSLRTSPTSTVSRHSRESSSTSPRSPTTSPPNRLLTMTGPARVGAATRALPGARSHARRRP